MSLEPMVQGLVLDMCVVRHCIPQGSSSYIIIIIIIIIVRVTHRHEESVLYSYLYMGSVDQTQFTGPAWKEPLIDKPSLWHLICVFSPDLNFCVTFIYSVSSFIELFYFCNSFFCF